MRTATSVAAAKASRAWLSRRRAYRCCDQPPALVVALHVPRADLGVEKLAAGKHSGAVTAAPDQQHAEPMVAEHVRDQPARE